MESSGIFGLRFLVLLLVSAVLNVAAVDAGGATIRLDPILQGLSTPVYVTNAHDGTDRLFVVEQPGRVKVLASGATTPSLFLDITSKVRFGGEQGLLGLAFHPQFATNSRFFVDYTRLSDGATVIAEYRASADPDITAASETVLLVIAQPSANHNGGMIEFGGDGYLYIGMGDAGDANDPESRAQNVDELLGKILRIDVDHPADPNLYSSPAGNPYAGATPGRDEIFAVGVRNPFRFSFDRETGKLYVGDVGQSLLEEIDIVTAGGNYGWRAYEGTHCTGLDPALCAPANFVAPIAQYDHSGGRCSIIGGYVYRGRAAALPAGAYVFGDLCTGEIFSLAGGAPNVLLDTSSKISSFGEDEAGEIYVVGLGGTVHRISLSPTATSTTLTSAPSAPLVQTISTVGGSSNVALASAGAQASASSTHSPGYAVGAVNNNERAGANPGNGGYWNDATPNTLPDSVQIVFNGSKSIDRVVVYSLQDNYLNPVEPTDTQTFSLYGLTSFTVEGRNGASWVPLATVSGNNLVKRTVSFPAYTTDSIRITVTGSTDAWSRITEIEAWGVSAPAGGSNVALASAGAQASASSTHSPGYAVGAVNNNERAGANPGNGGYWNDATPNTLPDSVQIVFNGSKSIDRVVVYSLQDNYLNPVEPTDTQTFSLYGLTGFTVEGRNGASWVPLATVSGNTLVKRTVSFPAYTTDSIRITVTGSTDAWSRITEIEAWGVSAPAGGSNVALASAGAQASASSTHSPGYAVGAVNNNERAGANPGNGGYWNDATPNTLPDSVQIVFNGSKSIDRVVVYSLQDNYLNPVEPTDSQTFSLYGLTSFTVEGRNGASWVPLATVSGNTLVKRTVSFPAYTTDSIRISVTGSTDAWSRITEIEAWGTDANGLPSTTTTLASSGSPATVGSSVTFTATVAGNNPTGSVSFTENGNAICAAGTLSGSPRTASCSTTSLGVGTHNIVANYGGDSGNAGSSSAPLTQVIIANGLTLTLSGTVYRDNGTPLAGVRFDASAGQFNCPNSDSSGHYFCTVPEGWSGTVTPSLSGYEFTPPQRAYDNVTADETQDYLGAAIETSPAP